jgi:cytidine deaminase
VICSKQPLNCNFQSELRMKTLITPAQSRVVSQFPDVIQSHIEAMVENGGRLGAERVAEILTRLNIDLETFMLLMLPLARTYSVTPISGFAVGAVVAGVSQSSSAFGNLYLGANLEFEGLPPHFAVHAEQAAVNNAWLSSEVGITSLVVSDSPCGCCRQFLYELATEPSVIISTLSNDSADHSPLSLEQLLPHAFTPQNLLSCPGQLMRPQSSFNNLELLEHSEDPVVLAAASAAEASYAPYTGGLAGCAIQTADGQIYSGRYAETAAYSPGLMPLESAISKLKLERGSRLPELQRAVLVEAQSKASKAAIARSVLESFAPAVTLGVFKAVRVNESAIAQPKSSDAPND